MRVCTKYPRDHGPRLRHPHSRVLEHRFDTFTPGKLNFGLIIQSAISACGFELRFSFVFDAGYDMRCTNLEWAPVGSPDGEVIRVE